jgi:hypothetical protein
MKVYVVITRYMFGVQDEAVFSSVDNAQQYLASRNRKGSPEVVEEHIRGDMESPNTVYSASWYDKSSDIHHYEGVYGTFKDAKKAAGQQGLVLTRVIDERLG